MDDCPLLPRVSALEAEQKRQAEIQAGHGADLKTICANVSRMADSMEKLIEIVPVITVAQGLRKVSVWLSPIVLLVGSFWGAYLALEKFVGH